MLRNLSCRPLKGLECAKDLVTKIPLATVMEETGWGTGHKALHSLWERWRGIESPDT